MLTHSPNISNSVDLMKCKMVSDRMEAMPATVSRRKLKCAYQMFGALVLILAAIAIDHVNAEFWWDNADNQIESMDTHPIRHQRNHHGNGVDREQWQRTRSAQSSSENATAINIRHHGHRQRIHAEKSARPHYAHRVWTTTIGPEGHKLRHSNRDRVHRADLRRRVSAKHWDNLYGRNHTNQRRIHRQHDVKQHVRFMNVTSVMNRRYFDSDSANGYQQRPVRTTAITTTTTPPSTTTLVPKARRFDRFHVTPVKNGMDNFNAYSHDDNVLSDESNERTWNKRRSLKPKERKMKKDAFMDDYNEDDYDDDDDEEEGVFVRNNNNDDDLNTNDRKINKNGNQFNGQPKDEDKMHDDVFPDTYIPGTLTKHKFHTLGTHTAVKESRHRFMINDQRKKELAASHATRVLTEGTCRWPKPRLIPVPSDPSKTYMPHCTILFRCGDDTGCCNSDARTCVARKTHPVDLYFYVSLMGSKQGVIEKQTFINHTDCHCVDKVSQARAKESIPEPMRQATVISCSCPKLFEKVLQEDGDCRCDCSSGNFGCDWMKKGKEHFSMEDRKCIVEGRCNLPTCEFGSYSHRNGRCPKREDKFAAAGFSYKRNHD